MSQLLEYELEDELESELEMMGKSELEGVWEEELEGEWEEELEGEGEGEWEEEWEGEGEWEMESEFENASLPTQRRRRGSQPPALPTQRRPVRPRQPTRLPTITIRVRPFVVLRGFQFNQTAVSPANQLRIERAARRIVASWRSPGGRRVRSVRLVGHTDSRGSRPYNQRLGRSRAMAVRARLIRAVDRMQPGLSRRIGLRNFIPQTLGETRPEAPNTTPAGRARNRRVQIFLSDV